MFRLLLQFIFPTVSNILKIRDTRDGSPDNLISSPEKKFFFFENRYEWKMYFLIFLVSPITLNMWCDSFQLLFFFIFLLELYNNGSYATSWGRLIINHRKKDTLIKNISSKIFMKLYKCICQIVCRCKNSICSYFMKNWYIRWTSLSMKQENKILRFYKKIIWVRIVDDLIYSFTSLFYYTFRQVSGARRTNKTKHKENWMYGSCYFSCCPKWYFLTSQ